MTKKEIPNDYYTMYEDRYQRIYKHGLKKWTRCVLDKELDVFVETADLKKDMLGIDIGCGEGFNSIYLSGKGMSMTGVDYSTTGLEKAREFSAKENRTVDFVQDDALILSKFCNNTFDFGVSTGCLHMLVKQSDRDKLFQQIKRVLKPNGIFFFLNRGDGVNEEYPDIENYLETREWRLVEGPKHIPVDILKLPHLPTWVKNWEHHLKEIDDNGFKVIHRFESINEAYSNSMCVIIKNKF
ncbi:MAG TPA: class I SAM-dependent methyltransferase [Patescibacteria group bacterium]|nr:MAG: hypothetical protein A2417_16450 [Bdellovibrionales bacterium RIFOXYC1_FULL_37_79]OFZ59171.1 MAG: hypothetical protein A2381_03855 [Bdellovibrionales bacterium RIFOXYB1_FULL_37_110]OFZ64176.1 MAG: hypothetical protein A2577_14885 [Bdellovibrionales bacterium RIFOXYD1_FULL_36_51]HLD89905.1 class I SAM-dependent methyltransferase [Patescibacteria group bacterium]